MGRKYFYDPKAFKFSWILDFKKVIFNLKIIVLKSLH